MQHIIKEKHCTYCKNLFLPKYRGDRFCCYECSKLHIIGIIKTKPKKPAKAKTIKTKPKKKTKTLAKWIGELQTIFNRYIRYRDRGSLCISCNKPLGWDVSKYDAGHFWSVSKYAGIRVHEHNVNGQCKGCNCFGDGMFGEYRIKLIVKIGQQAVDELEAIRHVPLKITIPEVQELIKIYREKVQEFEK